MVNEEFNTETEQMAIVYEATSTSADPDRKNDIDNDTLASLARSRGEMSIVDLDRESEKPSYKAEITPRKTVTNTGYMIRFVDDRYQNLTPFDIIEMDDIQPYPVSTSMMNSLPEEVMQKIHSDGYAQVSGVYSPDEQRFKRVRLGWEDKRHPSDRLVELIARSEHNLSAVDYFLVKESGLSIDEVAEIRGIEPHSVKKSIDRVKETVGNTL